MRFRKQLRWIGPSLITILRRHRGKSRSELVRRYLASHLRLGLHRGAPVGGTTCLFGFDVGYFNEEAFLILLSEVFVERHYHVRLSATSPNIIDGGANIGMSVLLWKHLYPNCRVTAFEPDPDTFVMLRRNVDANGLKDVTLVNKALSGQQGELTFSYSAAVPGNLAMTTQASSPLLDRRIVSADVLSSYITGPIDLLKLDIEGGEHDVIGELAACEKLGLIDQIVMEYHHHQTSGDDRLGELLMTFEANGFGYEIAASPIVPFTKGEFGTFLLYAYKKTPKENSDGSSGKDTAAGGAPTAR